MAEILTPEQIAQLGAKFVGSGRAYDYLAVERSHEVLRAERDRLREALRKSNDNFERTECELYLELNAIEVERDAAVERVKELEEQDKTSWQVLHDPLPDCGHPRACWQDRNYPQSEQNYNPAIFDGDPPMDYRCVMCEAIAALEADNAKLREALRPFAEYAVTLPPNAIYSGSIIADAIRPLLLRRSNQMENILDMRCTCSKCEERTKETYQRSVSCYNCGWKGTAIIRKGDKPSNSKECPHCGCSHTLTFGNDPRLAESPNAGKEGAK